jgi:hypothetical protein
MGRILVLIGVLMLAAGIIVPFAGSFGFLSDIGQIGEIVTADESELCNDGETLETESGPASRTSTDDMTMGRTVLYYCVNEEGERRDVTATFNGGLMQETGNILGGVGSMLTSGLAATGLSMGGVALIIVGVLMTVRTRPRVVNAFGQPVTRIDLRGGGDSPVGTSPFGISPVGAPPSSPNPTQTPPNAGGMQGDVIDFVRSQLDTAYRNGQITREDYDRAVEKLNRR